jgi:hypothetical protein
MIAGFVGGALVLALVGLIVLAAREVPDKAAGDERPGGDEQWGGEDWRDTVPNIRRAALTELDVELAWHPPSRDAEVPFRFRRFGHHLLNTAATEQFPPVLTGPYQGRHRT